MIYTIEYYTHRQCEPDWKLDDEAIPYYNITFVLGGEATFIVEGQEITCLAGDCLFLYPGSRRVARTSTENPLICAAFNIVDIPYPINLPPVIPFRKNSHINFYLREFDKAYREEPKNRIQLSAIVTLLLCELDTASRKASLVNPHVDAAEKYIKKNILKPISADDVAKAIHLNSAYFGALFKRCTGESVVGYINRYKMITAASFLSDPKITVTAAAEKVGFSDIYYFSKVFKKTYGISPMAFKKGEFPKMSYESYTLNHADSGIKFSTIPFPRQWGKADFSFNLAASRRTDAIVGLCSGDEIPWNWTDFNVIIQLQPDGLFWAIDGRGYNAEKTISYEPNALYRVEIHADIQNGRYDAFITDDGGRREQLAKNYAFRSTAAKAENLGKLCVRSGHNMPYGVIYTENFRITSDGEEPVELN